MVFFCANIDNQTFVLKARKVAFETTVWFMSPNDLHSCVAKKTRSLLTVAYDGSGVLETWPGLVQRTDGKGHKLKARPCAVASTRY